MELWILSRVMVAHDQFTKVLAKAIFLWVQVASRVQEQLVDGVTLSLLAHVSLTHRLDTSCGLWGCHAVRMEQVIG